MSGGLLAPQTGRPQRGSWQLRVRLWQYLVALPLLVGAVAFVLPLIWMVSTSLKTLTDVFDFPPRWIPQPVQWGNYAEVLLGGQWDILPFLLNTCIVAVLCVIGSVASSSLVGFGFARLRSRWRGPLFAVLVSTMMLPSQVTMIPLYLIFARLHWIDTFLPLIVPAFFGDAFYIFLMRQFFLTFPPELDDAALIDGCGYLGIYWRILLPLASPALATVAIFEFIWNWNSFLGPLIYLNKRAHFTIALALQAFIQEYSTQTPWHLLMAASVVALLPCLVIFAGAQRYFVQGIATTGLRG